MKTRFLFLLFDVLVGLSQAEWRDPGHGNPTAVPLRQQGLVECHRLHPSLQAAFITEVLGADRVVVRGNDIDQEIRGLATSAALPFQQRHETSLQLAI